MHVPPSLLLFLILLTLAGVAIGRFPRLHMNRATIALAGGTMLVAFGALTLDQAFHALNLETLALLLGMMILNANLRLAGFFRLVADALARRARTPRQLLILLVFASGGLSALFLNDTIVLMLTPLVIDLCRALEQRPVPFLIALVCAANVGSVATQMGNPQNMMIGTHSRLPFLVFTGYLLPVALMGLALTCVVLVRCYPEAFRKEALMPYRGEPVRALRPLMVKCGVASAGLVLAVCLGTPLALAALGASSALLITRRIKPERVFQEIDWSLLVFFAGLFVVTGAIREAGFSAQLFLLLRPVAEGGVAALAVVSVVLSNLVSNVPAVMLFKDLIPRFPHPTQAWLTLAMATTLAGNLTLLGSVANLIVAEMARSRGEHLGFMAYLKAGLPITLVTLVWGILWLGWIF